jgi:hypothetical protein
MTKDTISKLCKFLNFENPSLRHLDLSSNRMPSVASKQVLKALCKGKSKGDGDEYSESGKASTLNLETLSLNENTLFDKMKIEKLYRFEEGDVENEEDVVSSYLKGIIEGNSTLSHIDFSHCGLTERILNSVMESIKVNPSLVGIHLSSNPGINS